MCRNNHFLFMKKNFLNINDFYLDYIKLLNSELLNVDSVQLKKAANLIIKKIKDKKSIYVCGNGGSAAISNHYICDYLKLIRTFTKFKPKIYSLSNNIETVTAIANDISYDEVFKYQAESYCNKDDLVIIISSSGNSKNVIKLLNFTKKNKIQTIGFCGFKGGYLKKNSTVPIHVNANNYGISEDSHHVLMHVIMQYIIKIFKK